MSFANYISSAFYPIFYSGNQDASVRADFISRQKVFQGPNSILEPFAGDGSLGMLLAKRKINTTSLESDAILFGIMLDRFKRSPECYPHFTPLPLKITELEQTEAWDCLVLSNAISFLEDQDLPNNLEIACQLIKPDGLLILNSPKHTPLRQEQPKQEVGRKIFGHNILKHYASSILIESNKMQIDFTFSWERHNRTIFESVHSQIITLREPSQIIEYLNACGLELTHISGGWNSQELEPSSPNFLIVCRKSDS